MHTFAPDGYYREPIGPPLAHRGTAELRSFFTRCFSAGGGIGPQHCVVTDDGVRCALEFNRLRWGSHDPPPQAGIAVCERGQDGLLAAARVYHDIEAPSGQVDADHVYQLLLGTPDAAEATGQTGKFLRARVR